MREQLYACEPSYLLTYLTKIENATAEEVALAAGRFGEPDEEREPWEDIYEEDGDEACIKITGMLTQSEPSFLAKLFGFGGTSYPAILAAIDHAKSNPVVRRLRLMVNSPGGEAVSACDNVYSALRAWGPNCVAMNCGMMASGAYWISCGAARIEAMSPMAETGAIGVVTAGIDDSELLKNLGVKKVRIFSKNAPDKDYSFDTSKGRAALQERVDALESVFIARVAEGRHTTPEKVKADFGQGAVRIALHQEGNTCACALHCGMIDAVAPSVPNLDSRKQAGAYAPGRENMKLGELLTANPEAKAEFDKAIADARAEGKTAFDARVAAAKPFLGLKVTAENGYVQAEVDAISKAAVDVIAGAEEIGGLRSFVRMVDMEKEKRLLAAAQDETGKQKETPGQHTPPAAEVIVKANAQKIDIVALDAAAKKQDIDPLTGLVAAVETNDQLAKDKKVLAALGG